MSGDQSEHEAEEHSENKNGEWMNRATKRILGEMVLLALFVLFDVLEVWPSYHIIALLGAVVGISALAIMELSTLWWFISTAFAALGAFAIFVYAPATPVVSFTPPGALRSIPETVVVGSLEPGNDPTPPNSCDENPHFSADTTALKVLIGKMGLLWRGTGPFTAIQVGTCPVVTIERTTEGINVGAILYDSGGNLIARITKNQIDAISGPRSSVSREGDLSTFVVRDASKKELLYVKYLNSKTVRVRGAFGCPGHALAIIKDDEPVPGMISQACFGADAGTGISIQ